MCNSKKPPYSLTCHWEAYSSILSHFTQFSDILLASPLKAWGRLWGNPMYIQTKILSNCCLNGIWNALPSPFPPYDKHVTGRGLLDSSNLSIVAHPKVWAVSGVQRCTFYQTYWKSSRRLIFKSNNPGANTSTKSLQCFLDSWLFQ